jgi:ribosomal-protein-alanine N-acetyltransferase
MRLEDADDMAAMQQDDRFVAAFGHRSTPGHVRGFVARSVDLWERLGYGLWILRDRETGVFVGRGGIQPVTIEGVDEVELGYAILPEWWGRGLATETSSRSRCRRTSALAMSWRSWDSRSSATSSGPTCLTCCIG